MGSFGQAAELARFTSLGDDPTRKSAVIVTSMQRFRAAFEPIVRKVLEIDTGAVSTRNFRERRSREGCRPIVPRDGL